MSLFSTFKASATGLSAERLRMDVIADNISNAETTRTSQGGPYKRKMVVFSPYRSFENTLRKELALQQGVKVDKIVEDNSPFKLVYNPEHPDAIQEGEQKGYENLRAYILHRDGYKCQNPDCSITSGKYTRLDVHHIVYRSNGGSDSPSNLITLCSRCHTPKNHKGFLLIWKPKTKGFKDATFMNFCTYQLK